MLFYDRCKKSDIPTCLWYALRSTSDDVDLKTGNSTKS